MEPTVQRGVLARIVAEALSIEKSSNKEFGVSSSGSFSEAYLNILRSSGLTRSQEVEKMFGGGLQRVARLTVNEYEARAVKEEETKARKLKAKEDEELERLKEKESLAKVEETASSSDAEGVRTRPVDEEDDFFNPDDENSFVETYEMKIANRTEEILKSVWIEYDTRMFTKSTSRAMFYESNREQARALAVKEYEEEEAKKSLIKVDNKAELEVIERITDSNRQQYAKLLALERKEMVNQQQTSDTWVKYIYLLLEETNNHCISNDILLFNLDEYAQTILIRQIANSLRAMCGLPAYEVIYDPLDAAVIVEKLQGLEVGKRAGIDRPVGDVVEMLESKYGSLLKSVAALRGAKQIIDLAIQTLKKEIPVIPSTVSEAKREESSAMRQKLSQSRLEAIRNRGQPSQDGESVVGKL